MGQSAHTLRIYFVRRERVTGALAIANERLLKTHFLFILRHEKIGLVSFRLRYLCLVASILHVVDRDSVHFTLAAIPAMSDPIVH